MIEVQLSVPGRPVQTRRLGSGDHTIGRGAGAGIRVPHSSVSNRHALLRLCESTADISIYQMEGAGPVRRKGGGTLTQATVHSGDVFQIGECELKVVSGWTMALPERMRCPQDAPPAPTATSVPVPGGMSARIVGITTEDGELVADRVAMIPFVPRCTPRVVAYSALFPAAMILASRSIAVHTLGARHNVDTVFLDAQLRILAPLLTLAPWRVRLSPRRTRFVLWLPEGRTAAAGLRAGIFLCVTFDGASVSQSSGQAEKRQIETGAPPRGPQRRALFSLRLPLDRKDSDSC